MDMTKEEYFFYEWLIIEKDMTQEKFDSLSIYEFTQLKQEYRKISMKLQ